MCEKLNMSAAADVTAAQLCRKNVTISKSGTHRTQCMLLSARE